MNLQSLSLPDWMPWWGVVGVLVPVAFYLALFLLMPFSTFGLRARLRDLELHIEALHEEIRALTLRLPERGPDPYGEAAPFQPPIPPAVREGRAAPVRDGAPREGGGREGGPRGAGSLGDPVADRMLAYMRDKAQSDLQRADLQRAERGEPRAVRPRAEPRFTPPPPPREAEPPPPPPPLADYPPDADLPPPPPRVPGRFGRRPAGEPDGGEPRIDWPR